MHTATEHDIQAAKQIARQFDIAIRANESDAAQKAAQDFRALIVSANGAKGEFGIFAPDGAGTVMTAALAAKDEDVPHWGQNGLFVLETDHGRVLVGFTCPLDICSRFEFNAIDLDLPFISETGFQSHFYAEWPPVSVNEAAAIIFCQYAKAGKMTNIDPKYRQGRLERMPDFVQISSSDFQGVLTKTDSTGQIGFQF
ncbi:hypothetical protein J4E05_23650 [Thalassospira sp. NFXS8]|jgi:hypothetical protein|uniref:Uncharacterized protein n=1 Tax=Thalassospira profundimaris TaxID=502049 RepID=A0A367WFA6_9PROT|nr:hypothetical protein [Thalassospira profundimaris]RCK40144.1 hypothetical protein TH25_25155 [Thalassospira profundimaris]